MINSFKGKHQFLSNFFIVYIEYEGKTYRSVEHAYQASKTLDQDSKERIRLMVFSKDAKREGRELKLREDWEKVKDDIMLKLLRKKFEHQTLRQFLLKTGDEELVEGNFWGDTYWGVCNGKGKNMLGKLLMKVRKEIRLKKGG